MILGLVILFVGCSATVSAPFIDGGFGAATAIWWHGTSGDDASDAIILTNVPDPCPKMQDLITSTIALGEAGYLASGGDPALTCGDIETEFLDYVGANAALYYAGANYAIGLTRGRYEVEEYAFGDSAGVVVSATGNSAYSDLADFFAPENLASEGCFPGGGDLYAGTEGWSIEDGAWTLTAVTDKTSVSGSVKGYYIPPNGADHTAFEASFSAAYCPYEI